LKKYRKIITRVALVLICLAAIVTIVLCVYFSYALDKPPVILDPIAPDDAI